MARLFFALWPDAPSRPRLAARAAELVRLCGGRAVPEANIHLTLAFLGEVDAARVPLLHAAATQLEVQPFRLELDRLGSFSAARVGWSAPGRMPEALAGLAAGLKAALESRGFTLDDRPFAPHATLARRIERAVVPQAIEPIAWQAEEFALVESRRGTGRYETLGAFGR